MRLFYEDSISITAEDTWERLVTEYEGSSAIFEDIAVGKFANFRFDKSKSVAENLMAYQEIVYELQNTDAGITTCGIASRLVNSLPSSWESFKQG